MSHTKTSMSRDGPRTTTPSVGDNPRVVRALEEYLDAVERGQRPERGAFLARYAIVAAAAYVIFRSSRGALGGLLAGLFLPVAAIFCEAFYEVAVALRRPDGSCCPERSERSGFIDH